MNRMEIQGEAKRRPLYQRTAEALSEILENVEPGYRIADTGDRDCLGHNYRLTNKNWPVKN